MTLTNASRSVFFQVYLCSAVEKDCSVLYIDKLLLNCIEQKIFIITVKVSPCQNKTALSSLRENVILTKIILTTNGTNGCVKGDTWCQGGLWQAPK